MELALNSASRRFLAAAGIFLCALYLSLDWRIFSAAWLAENPNLKSLQLAARLDPTNGEYRDRIGRYYAFATQQPIEAVPNFRAAVQLNPHSARYWFDLASAYQVESNAPQEAFALERASEAEPTSPEVAWEAGNLYLAEGNTPKALREFRIVLENDPALAPLAIQYCWRARPDVDELLKNVVPNKAAADLAFLNLLMAENQASSAPKVWDALMSSPDSVELRQLFDYFQFLINHQMADQARQAWQQAMTRSGMFSYLPSPNNLIVNGDFRLNVLNGGFDWQYRKQEGVKLTLDSGDFHGGHRSLSITFDGAGIADAGVRQYISVHPKTEYKFSAYYKNGDLEGAGGAHITIEDPYKQSALYDSDELKETGFWKSITGEFVTSEDCRLLLLQIRRLPEGSPIRGKLWVDDFRLVAKAQ